MTKEFDFAERANQRAREKNEAADQKNEQARKLAEKALKLSVAINAHYGAKYPAQFEQTHSGSKITITKKAGASRVAVEVLGNEKYKLVGGGGAGGFSPDRLRDEMKKFSEKEMMDRLEDWFAISN
jgi:hypothetical protein